MTPLALYERLAGPVRTDGMNRTYIPELNPDVLRRLEDCAAAVRDDSIAAFVVLPVIRYRLHAPESPGCAPLPRSSRHLPAERLDRHGLTEI